LFELETFIGTISKDTVFSTVSQYLKKHHLEIESVDKTRPWGGFLVIKDSSLRKFATHFFPGLDISDYAGLKLSPKILIVQPGERLSWQYHNRRSELWTVASGEIGMVISDSDHLSPVEIYKTGKTISIDQGTRHRAEGLDNWGVIAEIWQHINPGHPSDEDDIIRVQDDYGR
jgi:mannose-6-phosphate isomerase